MHELAVCQSIVQSLESEFAEADLLKIREIHLKVGVLSGVEPEFITQVYPYMVGGTPLEASSICCLHVSVLAECAECGQTFRPVNYVFACPACGQRSSQVVEGKELLIYKIVSLS